MSDVPLDVLVVGAGVSGVGAARALVGSGRAVAIVESRDDLGGTWDLFRYPGVRSDSDMATFGYRSRPWAGDRSLAPGEDILAYVRASAEEAGVVPLIRFGTRALRADFSSATATWSVECEDVRSGEVRTIACRLLFVATGYYRYDRGHRPEWPGTDDFAGETVYPQSWPESLHVRDKNVVIVGSGATAVTLLPALAEQGARVSMLQRSPTYVAGVPALDRGGMALRRRLPARAAGDVNRWRNIARGMVVYEVSRRAPGLLRAALRRGVVARLGPDFPVDVHFSPDYDPWDQRLCATPDGEFFTAIRSGRAEVVTDGIERFERDGVRLTSGRHLPADVVVTATGLEILVFGGLDVSVDGEPVDLASRVAYRGMLLDGVPNLAFAIGYTNASWTLKIDLVTDYFARLLDEMDRRGAASVTPRYRGSRGDLRPLIDLASGYVRRGAHLMPRRGVEGPWRIRQNYLADRWLFRRGSERDDQLEFGGSRAAGSGSPAAPGASFVEAADRADGNSREKLTVHVFNAFRRHQGEPP